MSTAEQYIVIGAGPVGLLAALTLAKERMAKVTVYESRDSIPSDPQESYPIGLNPRGVRAMDRVNPDMALAIRNQCYMVDGWRIFAGKKKVAEVASAMVIGTTRCMINHTLLDEVKRSYRENIEVKWGHRLKSFDVWDRRLVFEHQGKEVDVDAGGARVIAADGVGSGVRKHAEATVREFTSKVTPWGVRFRLLFSKPGAQAPGLDPRYHYVLGGVYTSIIQGSVWVVAIGAKERDTPEVRDLLLADEATPERVEGLRRYVESTAPFAAPLITDDELEKYFSRRSFSGAVVKVNQLNIGEWIVLLGDSAHSVIPPTGEGFNSGAEDVEVLMSALDKSRMAPFAAYNDMRLPDVHALHELAFDLNRQFTDPVPERISKLMTTIMVGVCKACWIYQWSLEDLTFGVDCSPPKPYRDIISMWKRQRFLLLPLARLFVWPCYILVMTVRWPLVLPFRVYTSLTSGKGRTSDDRIGAQASSGPVQAVANGHVPVINSE